MSKTKSYFGVVICAFLASLFVSGLYNNIVFAASASISTTGTVSIDVSAAGNSANLGSDTLTVNTTCSTGYTVSISSSIADTTLYKDGDNTSTSKITPSTGTVTSPASILGNNLGTWGYSTTATSVQDNFIGLTNTPTIIKQSTTASGDGSGSATTGNDTIPVYYGVSIPTSLEPGTYTMAKDSSNNPGTIVYQLTMPTECNPYIIKYNGNNNDAGTTMSVTNTVDEGQSTTLMPSNFKRAGYGFAGWNTKADGTGVDFGPMETVTLSTTDTKGNALLQAANQDKEITLYAKWIASAGNIQGWTGCNSLAQGAVTALTDTRDNNVYAIAKLADGNCWMIENLRLGGSSAMNLTTANTVTAFTLPASTNTFTTSNYTTIEMSAKNTLEAPTSMTSKRSEVYSYGNYYSWPAAIGSTTAYSTNNQSVSTSVCPSGWHLPKGGDSNNTTNSEFWKLGTAIMNGTTPNVPNSNYSYYDNNVTNTAGKTATAAIRSYPNNFIYSDNLIGSSFPNRGSSGYYWSSTVSSSNYSYILYLYSSGVSPGTTANDKPRGSSVRCVADEQITIEKAYEKAGKMKQDGYYRMQDMSDSICGMVNVLDEPGQTQLIDARDNKVYWATKLEDGKCWMTQNLDHDIDSTKTYTPADTDIPANWTPDKSTYPTSTTTWDTSTTGYNIQQSYDPGNKIWNGVTTSSSGTTINNMTQGTNQHYHLGNYYNWSAAVAMNNTSSYTTQNTDLNQSICPKGWMLPKSGDITTAGSFRNLINQYNWGSSSMTDPNMWAAPLYFPLAGAWSGSSNYVAYDGYFWSSVVGSSSFAYTMFGHYNDTVSPAFNYYRAFAFSVRCVSR